MNPNGVPAIFRQERFFEPLFTSWHYKGVEFRWRQGRKLSGTEEYAVAKMRLFQAFDEVENLATSRPEIVVDDSNLENLLEKLDL